MANNDKENKIEKFTKEAIGKTLNQFNKEIGMADLVEVNKNQDRILNGILSQVNDENTEKTEKSNIITLDNSTDGIVELKEIQGDTNVNVSKIEEMPITHDIGDKEGNVFTLNEVTKGAISIGEIQGNTMVNCNKDDKKELVLMKDLSTQGDNNITLTEGVDGGKVDVALEGNTLVNVSKTKDNYITHEREEDTTGNHVALVDEGYIRPMLNGKTMVNVCDQKDSVAISKAYTVENSGNHIALQGDVDGNCRPVITGNTLVNILQRREPIDLNKTTNTGTIPLAMPNKLNTEYTIIINLSNLNLDGQSDIGLAIRGYLLDETYYSTSLDSSRVKGNVIKLKWIETEKQFKNILIGISNSINPNNPTFTLENVMILEGDYTDKPIPDYFEGLQSSFEDKVVPENLVNVNSIAETNSNYMKYFKDNPCTKCTVITDSNNVCLSYRNISTQKWEGLKIVTSGKKVYEAPNGMEFYAIQQAQSIGDFTAIVVEGDYTNYDFSDYDPTKSGKYKVDYKVTGKNKIDNDLLIEGVTLSGNDGTEKTGVNEYKATKEYIPVTPGANLRLSLNAGEFGNLNILCFYDNEYKFISSVIDSHTHNQIVVPQNAKYLRLRVATQATDVQLEEGTEVTSYEPYKEYTKTLYLNSPLLEGDTIEEKDDGIYHVHRYKEVVLDGSDDEKWVTQSLADSDTTLGFRNQANINSKEKANALSDRFVNMYSWDKVEHMYFNRNAFNITISKSKLQTQDVAGFRQWLQANHTTVVYELYTPQYETISEDSIVCASYVSGHLDFNTAVPVEKVEFKNTILENKYLYTNTEYTIQFEADKEGKAVISLGGTTLAETSIVKGINKIAITTPETLADNNLVLEGIGFNISDIVVTPTIEQDFGYFSGLSSTFEDRLVPENILGEKVTNTTNKIEYSLTKNIKPNTIYTIYLEGAGVLYCGFQKDSNWVKYLTPSRSIQTITTDDNVDINKFSFHSSESNIRVNKCFLLEGDYASYDFSDYDPTKVGKYKVDYKVTGKNKFDGEMELGSINYNTGVVVSVNNIMKSKNYIEVKPSTLYTITSSHNKADVQYVFEYDYKKNFIKFTTVYGKITTTSKTKFILTKSQTNNVNGYTLPDNLNTNIQIEEGDTATEYEPYKESTKTLYLNSPLLEGDTIEERNGGIYHVHRYRKLNLTSAIWHQNSSYFVSDLNSNTSYVKENIVYCDKIPTVSYQSLDGMTSYGIALVGSFRINLSNMNAQNNTFEEFKQWLIDNNPVVIYEMDNPTYELIEQSNLAIPSYSNGHLDLTSAVPVSKVNFLHFEEELTYLYPSTSYTVQFVSDKAITVDIALGGTQLLAQNIVKSLNRISITTPETLADNKLVIDGIGAKISEVVVTDTNREFGYFEGMKSVGECEGLEVKSSNKNLIDPSKVIEGKDINSQTGEVIDKSNYYALVDYVPIQPNKPLIYSVTKVGTENNPINGTMFHFYDNNKKHIYSCYLLNTGLLPSSVINGKTPNNAHYLRISYGINDGWGTSYESLLTGQLEYGTTKTDYIPHQSNKQQLTHEPLRAVGNTRDRYVLIDGKWYIERKCKEVVLDGSEPYWSSTGYGGHETRNTFEVSIDNIHTKIGILKSICDTYIVMEVEDIPEKDDVYRVYSNGTYAYFLFTPSTSIIPYRDTEAWKEYLSENPITIIVECSPSYEPINYNPLVTYSDITHISTNSAIPTNITIKNHGFNCLLKPSTTYTVSSNLGLNTVTTGANIGDSCLRFYNENTSNVTTMKNVLLLEGDWSSKADLVPNNFSGIESAFEQELVTDESDEHYGKYKVTAKVVGKNLFKFGSSLKGGVITLRNTDGTPILKAGTYTISSNCTKVYENVPVISIYDMNDKRVNTQFMNLLDNITISCNNDIKNIFLYCNGLNYTASTGKDYTFSNIQIEQGNTASEYEPYKESNATFYVDEPLRGVGDVKDKIFIKDDKVIVERKCIVKTVDGSENGWEIKKDNGNSITFMLRNDLFANAYSSTPCICNLFTRDIAGGLIKADNSMRITEYSGVERLFLVPTKEKCSDLQSFRQWLQQHPITVIYQLAEPTYEEVEYSSNRLILDTFNNESFNNSTLFLDTNISPKLSFKPLYEELVYVKSNTKYYIQFNAVGSGEVVINLGGTELTTEIVERYNCIPITTPSESTNLMTIIGQGITISEVVVSEVICGGYYKGLQSCFEEHMENGKYRVLLRGIALDGSKVNGIKLYINEPLRGIDGVKDRLCIKNGKLMVERKYGSVILDGSDDEIYTKDNVNLSERNNYSAYYSNKNIGTGDSYRELNKLLCDKMPTCAYDYATGNFGDETGVASISERILVSVPKTKLATIDLDGFINYLNTSPMTFIYQLATPTYEEATNEYGLPIVFEGYENGIVYIDSAVTPTTHIKYTSNNQLATTLAEAEEQNITTQEDINMNVITYMMDIDMMLTDMEMSNDISVMAVRRDSSNENMLDRMSEEDKKVYRDNTVVMLEKMITAKVLDKEDIEGRIDMYYNKNRISKEQYKYLKSLL